MLRPYIIRGGGCHNSQALKRTKDGGVVPLADLHYMFVVVNAKRR